jgi:hypothetical protein
MMTPHPPFNTSHGSINSKGVAQNGSIETTHYQLDIHFLYVLKNSLFVVVLCIPPYPPGFVIHLCVLQLAFKTHFPTTQPCKGREEVH